MRGGVPVSPSVDVPMPQARILYGQKDISSDISPYLISVSYTDRLSGESDELELRLEDTDGRWRGDWYPGKGDALTVSIGYAGQELVSCGSFEIDEIELSFPPDEVSIRALATGISVSCRTRKSKGYEKTTLAGVVRVVCGRLGLTPAGEVADIPIDRVTQYQESDLAFLTRLAGEYGHTFKISGKKMIFQRKDGVLAAESVRTFKREDVTSCSFRDKLKDIPKKVKIKKQDAGKKTLKVYGKGSDDTLAVVGTTTAAQKKRGKKSNTASGDELRIVGRGSQVQLEAKGNAALQDAELERCHAELALFGDPSLRAGVSVTLGEDFGAPAGKYLVTCSRHEISREGYATTLTLARTAAGEKKA